MSEADAIAIHFDSEAAANRLVAGVPAVARALKRLAEENGFSRNARVLISVPGGWIPQPLSVKEAKRLAPSVMWDAQRAENVLNARWVSGARLIAAPTERRLSFERSNDTLPLSGEDDLAMLSRQIIAATGKPLDGIVSRTINRPISRAITGIVLRFAGARPWHATAAAGLLGVAMMLCLLLGGAMGLVAGALLFQLASIVDGVDGEMARATFRSSRAGAIADSLTDIAVNLGFFAGVSVNLYWEGEIAPALAGLTGVLIVMVGNGLLGRQAWRTDGTFTFDTMKRAFRAKPTRLNQILTYVIMRDLYAFAAMVLILAGAQKALLLLFLAGAIIWLCNVIATLVRVRRAGPTLS